MTKDELVFIAERAGFKCSFPIIDDKEFTRLETDFKKERFGHTRADDGGIKNTGMVTSLPIEHALGNFIKILLNIGE